MLRARKVIEPDVVGQEPVTASAAAAIGELNELKLPGVVAGDRQVAPAEGVGGVI